MLDTLARLWRDMDPPTLFVSSFLTLIAVGTLGMLVLPGLHAGPRLGVIDALFTMTSAVCVTGLAVVDTATHFTFWGQLWILLFIQLGGLGLITLTTQIIGMLGRRLSLRSEMIAVPPGNIFPRGSVGNLAVAAGKLTLGAEALGALLLWLQWWPELGAGPAAWHAIFQSVSAFCNAGFSTFPGSMTPFALRPGILVVLSFLVIAGGFGYLSSMELQRWWKGGGTRGPFRLSTHTFAALAGTGGLIVLGTLLFSIFEWGGVLSGMSAIDKLANAFFLSVMPRSGGFNAVSYIELSNAGSFLTILLMIVGGSPGSMAGGLKTTALAILVALAISRMRGRRFVELHDRTVPDGTVQRTVSLAVIFGSLVAAMIFALTLTEFRDRMGAEAHAAFLPLAFEVVSAFGTVGLSMDVTPALSPWGKLAVVIAMFVGRVGPLTFFAALSIRSSGFLREFRPAREDLIIG